MPAHLRTALKLLLILSLGLALRLVFVWNFHGNYDQDSYEIVVSILQRSGHVYSETARYNYSPVWMNILFILKHLSDATSIPFHAVVRSFLTLADLAAVLMLGLLARRVSYVAPRSIMAAHWLQPGAMILTGFHGQFELLAMLPVLTTIWFCCRFGGHKSLAIWLLLTVALIIKHDAIFIIWPLSVYLWGGRKALVALLASGIVFLLTFIPYFPSDANGIVQHVFLYQSNVGDYGLSVLLPRSVSIVLMAAIVFALPIFLKRKRRTLIQALTISLLGWLVFTSGFGVQYCTFIFLIAVLDRRNWVWLYVCGVLTFVLELGWIVPISPLVGGMAQIILWGLCAVWLGVSLLDRRPDTRN